MARARLARGGRRRPGAQVAQGGGARLASVVSGGQGGAPEPAEALACVPGTSAGAGRCDDSPPLGSLCQAAIVTAAPTTTSAAIAIAAAVCRPPVPAAVSVAAGRSEARPTASSAAAMRVPNSPGGIGVGRERYRNWASRSAKSAARQWAHSATWDSRAGRASAGSVPSLEAESSGRRASQATKAAGNSSSPRRRRRARATSAATCRPLAAERVGDLVVGATFEIAQRQGHALPGRDPAAGDADLAHLLAARAVQLGRSAVAVALVGERARGPVEVARDVELGEIALGQVGERPRERRLDQRRGAHRAAGEAVADAVETPLVGGVEELERLAVTALNAACERAFVALFALARLVPGDRHRALKGS